MQRSRRIFLAARRLTVVVNQDGQPLPGDSQRHYGHSTRRDGHCFEHERRWEGTRKPATADRCGDDMSISTQGCARCHRPVPDQFSDEFLSWEADETGEQLICPGCLTPGQARATAGDGDVAGETATAIAQSHDGNLRDKMAADLRDKMAAELSDKVVPELSDKVAELLSDTVAVELSDKVAAELSDKVAELEELGGMGASRVEAIAGGEEPTNGELEELGYVFVQLLRALRKV